MKLLKSREMLTLVAILAAMFGLAILVWTVRNNLPSVTFTAAANTRPARETRQAQTATAAAQNTITARQTRRARRTPTFNTIQNAETPLTQNAKPLPTFTRDPRTPTPDLGTPEPTDIVIFESPTPYPSSTPLPALPKTKREGDWAENLIFDVPSSESVLKNAIPNFQEILGSLSVPADGSKIGAGVWAGETLELQREPPPGQKSVSIPLLRIALFDLANGQVQELVEGNTPVWSPTAKYIAYSSQSKQERLINVIDVAEKRIWPVATLKDGEPSTQYAWISDTQLLYYKNGLQVFDLTTGESQSVLGLEAYEADQVALEADHQARAPMYITTAPATGDFAVGWFKGILVFKWKENSASLVQSIDDGVENRTWALSPDGSTLAYPSATRRQLMLVNAHDSAIAIALPHGHSASFVGSWSPDSTSLLYRDLDGVKIVNRDGSGLRALHGFEAAEGPYWVMRGSEIIWVSNDGQLMSSIVSKK